MWAKQPTEYGAAVPVAPMFPAALSLKGSIAYLIILGFIGSSLPLWVLCFDIHGWSWRICIFGVCFKQQKKGKSIVLFYFHYKKKKIPNLFPPFWNGTKETHARLKHMRGCNKWRLYFPNSSKRLRIENLDWLKMYITSSPVSFSYRPKPTEAVHGEPLAGSHSIKQISVAHIP